MTGICSFSLLGEKLSLFSAMHWPGNFINLPKKSKTSQGDGEIKFSINNC